MQPGERQQKPRMNYEPLCNAMHHEMLLCLTSFACPRSRIVVEDDELRVAFESPSASCSMLWK